MIFTGPLTGPALGAAYGVADLLVLPSRSRELRDGRGRGAGARAARSSRRRSAACPRRSAGRRSAPCPGLLVPPDDPAALAGAPARLARRPGPARTARARGRAPPTDPAALGRDRRRPRRRPRPGRPRPSAPVPGVAADEPPTCRPAYVGLAVAPPGRRRPRAGRPGLAVRHRPVRRRLAGHDLGGRSLAALVADRGWPRWRTPGAGASVARALGVPLTPARLGGGVLPLAVPQRRRCPAASSVTPTAGVRHGRDVGDLGAGLRATVWDRVTGQVVQVGLLVVALALARRPRCAASRRSPLAGLGGRRLPAGGSGAGGARSRSSAATCAALLRPARRRARRRRLVRLHGCGHVAVFLVAVARGRRRRRARRCWSRSRWSCWSARRSR